MREYLLLFCAFVRLKGVCMYIYANRREVISEELRESLYALMLCVCSSLSLKY